LVELTPGRLEGLVAIATMKRWEKVAFQIMTGTQTVKKIQWLLGEFERMWATRPKAGDVEQMCGMVPGLGSVSGCPQSTPWRRRHGAYGHKCMQVS
jgi:hypothetical protein